MTSDLHAPPAKDELEVSIFGPGYGEALAIHIGGGQWVLVDSCIQPNSHDPATIHYLREIGVDPTNSVPLIVITHWHDDHIRGIAETVEHCSSAVVAISTALGTDEFLTLVSLYASRKILDKSGVDELEGVLRNLQMRRASGSRFGSPKFAIADRPLLRQPLRLGSASIEAAVYSLSPSDAVVLQAQAAFGQLLPLSGDHKSAIASPPRNDTSVVLWITVASHRLLLGADLESTNDQSMGWTPILDGTAMAIDSAHVFKVPHHGAQSAHDARVWTSLLVENPYAILTPFMKGRHLIPNDNDVFRITGLTQRAYATSLPSKRTWKSDERVIRKTMNEVTASIEEINLGWGQIRLRSKVQDTHHDWTVALFGDALRLESLPRGS